MAIRVYTNEQLIETRSRIGRYATLAGLGVIFGGLIFSFQNNILVAYSALIVGFVLSNIGAYLLNRWGLNPHKKLEDALKGLDKRYHLYNYLLPAPNVLLTPYAVTVFLLKNQDGLITGTAHGWRQGSSIIRFLRSLSAEPLGDPLRELAQQQLKIKSFIERSLGTAQTVPIEGFIIFTNPKAQVRLQDVDAPVIVLSEHPDAIKNSLRRDKRTATLPNGVYHALSELFAKEVELKTTEAERGFRFWQR